MESTDKSSTEREGTPSVVPAPSEEQKVVVAETSAKPKPAEDEVKTDGKKKTAKSKCSKKHAKTRQKKPKKRNSASDSSSDSGSDEAEADQSSSSSSDSEDSASELEDAKKKRSSKKRQELQKSKKKVRTKKQKKPARSQQSSVSDSDSDSSEVEGTIDSGDEGDQRTQQDLAKQLQLLQLQQQLQQQAGNSYQYGNDGYQYTNAAYQYGNSGLAASIPPPAIYDPGLRINSMSRSSRNRRGQPPPSGRARIHGNGIDPTLLQDGRQHKDKRKRQKATKMDYKRVDQVWDNTIHNYKLQDTAEGTIDAQYDEFLFHVRRTFDWEGKYKATVVDIKSKSLRECLQDVIGNIKGVSLVEETPKLDPNMLFLYLEDLRKYMKDLKKAKPTKGDKHERRKEQKRIESRRQHLKILIQYVDKDYADIKKSLYPMLENGLITFDPMGPLETQHPRFHDHLWVS